MDKRSFIDLYGVKYQALNDNPAYLSAQIGRAFATVCSYAFRTDLAQYSLYSKSYPGVAIEEDAYGTYYSTVPVRLMQLPDSAESVRRIHATHDQKTLLFIAIPKDSWTDFELLDVSKVSRYIPYSVTNDRVEYAKKPPVSTVTMDLVRAFMDYSDNDEVQIPSGMEQLFEECLNAFLNGTPPPNKLNV